MANYKLTQTGPEVQDLLNRIQDAKIEGGTITIGENSITPLTEETDPTVPSWAKQPSKPTYTASEIGAISSETLALAQIPTDGTYSRSEFESAYCAVSELLKVVDGEYRFASVDYDNGASVVTREVPVGGSSTETMGETDCTVSLLDGSVAVYISFNREDGNITVSTVAVTAYDIAAWNAKYDKPSGGIPKTDLASAVQASLDKADNAVRFNASQDLTTQQKLTARRNISALGEDEVQMVYRGYQTEPGFEGKEGDIYISDGEYISISPTYTEGWGRWYRVRSYNVSSFSGGHRIKVTNIRLGPFGGSIRYVDANDNTIGVDIDDSEFFCPIGTKTVTITADEAESYPSADFYQEISPSSLKEYHDGGWVNHVPFSGSYNDLTDKPDLSQFITKSVNDLVNYYTKSETYTKEQVQQLIAAIQGVQFVSVTTLPTASADTMGGKIYLVPSSNPQTQNVKDEYITIDNGAEAQTRYTWEQIGSTAADLDGYVTDADLNTALADYTTTAGLTTLLAGKQDTIDAMHKLDYAYLSNTPTIPDAVVANPTVPSGTTPTDLENLKVGNNYYAIPQGGSENAQIRASSQAGATGEGDIYPMQESLPSIYLSGSNTGVYTFLRTTGNLVISPDSYFSEYMGGISISRWTGSDWEVVIDSKSYSNEKLFPTDSSTVWGYYFRDLINNVSLGRIQNSSSTPITVSVASFFTPDSGDVAKIKLAGADTEGKLKFNVGFQAVTAEVLVENFAGNFYKRVPATENVVQYSLQSLTAEQRAQARRNIGAMATDGAQKLIPYGDYSNRNEGDIFYVHDNLKVGNDLVNTLNGEYLEHAFGTLIVDFVQNPTGNDGETITIHDNDFNNDIFKIVISSDGSYIWGDIYDVNDDYYGYFEPGYPTTIGLGSSTWNALTISSTEQNPDVSIYECYGANVPYEVVNGEGHKRMPVPTNVSAFTNDAGYLTAHQDITGKADKVSGATADNFAGLDANGNLKDSGKKASDFATAAQGAKADTAYQKPSSGIPSTDLASGVIPSVPVTDVTVGGTSVVSNGTAVVPAIPDAVEANPTVPQGTTPTALSTLQVGSNYFSVPDVASLTTSEIDTIIAAVV